MAEGKSGSNCNTSPGGAGHFAKRVQRTLSRAQEKVLQKLGKSVETKDEHFDLCVQNLGKQQRDGSRLFKDLKAHYNSMKVMRETAKRLSQTLLDIYESDWEGDDDLPAIVEGEDLLWNDYEEKLVDQAIRTMDTYMSQFPDVKERVAKRGRKLVDYDSSRHQLETLQNAKKKDEDKLAKAEEELNYTQSVFEEINTELMQELPVLYESRIGCYVTVFENLSNLRDIFYKEMSTLNSELYGMMKSLETQHSEKVFIIKGLQRSGSKNSKKRRSFRISTPIPRNKFFSAFDQSTSPVRTQKSSTSSREGLEAELPTNEQAECPETSPTKEVAPGDLELNLTEKPGEEQKEEDKEKEDDSSSDQISAEDGLSVSISTGPPPHASEPHTVNCTQEEPPASLVAPGDPEPTVEETGAAVDGTDDSLDAPDVDGEGLKGEVQEEAGGFQEEESEAMATGGEESHRIQEEDHQDHIKGVPDEETKRVKAQ